MSTIRLAFCGASGTGKSTLAKSIAERVELPLCPVGSREVSKAMGFESPYDVDAAGKRTEFQIKLLEQKIVWEQKHRTNGFVTDRMHIDNLTYTSLHGSAIAEDPAFLGDVRFGMDIYTHLVFCPMLAVFNVGDDPARVSERSYHERYEAHLNRLVMRYAAPRPILYLTSGVREARISQVLRFISPL